MSKNHRQRLHLVLWMTIFSISGCNSMHAQTGWTPDYAKGDMLLPHQSWSFQSQYLDEERRINVYLPSSYEDDASKNYTVLYMPDGGEKEDFPHLTHTVDLLIDSGEITPMIVVGIENTQRRRDLTGPTTVDSDREVAPVVGESKVFRQFVALELMPEIERRYRTDGKNGIIGESVAGLFIVETFFEKPDLFEVYIAISPSVWWNDQTLVKEAAGWLLGHQDIKAHLYLSHADEADIVSGVKTLVKALTANPVAGLVWSYQPYPYEKHHTIYRATKEQALKWAFAPSSSNEPE